MDFSVMEKRITVSCGKYLDIAHASELKKRFLTAFQKKPTQIQVIADKVERVDSAGLQILVSVKLACSEKNILLKFHKATEILITTASLIGLQHRLEL